MDWATGDFTQTYADTFYLPSEADYDEGVYALKPETSEGSTQPRAPYRRYGERSERGGERGGERSERGGERSERGAHRRPSQAGRPSYIDHDYGEGYGTGYGTSDYGAGYGVDYGEHYGAGLPAIPYTPSGGFEYGEVGDWRRGAPPRYARERFYGNVQSARDDRRRAIYDITWDERPMHYNPNAGSDWAHLMPPPSARPYRGGPSPTLAYPVLPQGVAMNAPDNMQYSGPPCASNAAHTLREAFGGTPFGGTPFGGTPFGGAPPIMYLVMLFVMLMVLSLIVNAYCDTPAVATIGEKTQAPTAPAGG